MTVYGSWWCVGETTISLSALVDGQHNLHRHRVLTISVPCAPSPVWLKCRCFQHLSSSWVFLPFTMLRVLLTLAGLCEFVALRSMRSMPSCSFAQKAVHGTDDPNMVAKNSLATTFMEVVAPSDDIHVTEAPCSEINTWMDDILIDVMGCVDRSSLLCAESEDHCVCQAMPGPIRCCPFGVSTLAGGPVSPTSCGPSSVGDPHITSVTGGKFDLWRLGWSTFLQVPQQTKTDNDVKLLFQGNVQRFWGSDECAPVFLDQVHISGSWAGNRTVHNFSGSLESDKNFTVSIDQVPRCLAKLVDHHLPAGYTVDCSATHNAVHTVGRTVYELTEKVLVVANPGGTCRFNLVFKI